MSYTLIDGKMTSEKIRKQIKEKIINYSKIYSAKPGIAVILVGDDPASSVYVNMKEKAASEVGMSSIIKRLPINSNQEDVLKLIEHFNNDENIHGILVQLPLPEHINEFDIITAISPEKDVDGFHPVNVGKLSIGKDTFAPCTPWGVMRLLKEYNIDPKSKHAVIVGRSNIVGKPAATLLLEANATVTICHSKTINLKDICRQADILVAAVGKPRMINQEYVKKGVVVIDVGINRVDGKLCGDVDFESVSTIASAITPVPKGVGPMTIAMLMENTLKSFEIKNSIYNK